MKVAICSLALSSFLFGSGCSSGGGKANGQYVKAWRAGSIEEANQIAHEEFEKNKDSKKEDVSLKLAFDSGTIAGYVGDYESSEEKLNWALTKVKEEHRKEAEKSLSGYLMSSISDPFEVSATEEIMAAVYAAYASLGLKKGDDPEKGNVADALDNRQKEFLTIFEEQIQKAKAEAKEEISFGLPGSDKKSTFQIDGASQEDLDDAFGVDFEMAKIDGGAEKEFLNPFAYWLSGTIRMNEGDFDNARVDFEKALGMIPESELFKESLKSAISGEQEKDVSYVIYEGGRSPRIFYAPVAVNIPPPVIGVSGIITALGSLPPNIALKIPSRAVVHIPVAVPRGQEPELTVDGGTMENLVNFDDRILKNYAEKAERSVAIGTVQASGIVLTRAAAAAASVVSYIEAAKKGNAFLTKGAEEALKVAIANLSAPIVVGKSKEAVFWDMLPRVVNVTKVKTPEDGVLKIAGEDVSVPVEGVNVVRVRKLDEYWPATVQVFSLAGSEVVPVKKLSASPRPEGSFVEPEYRSKKERNTK